MMQQDFKMSYDIIISQTENEGMKMETYGVSLTKVHADGKIETAKIPNITPDKKRANELLGMMQQGFVTLLTAGEIVEDFLEI